MEPGDSIRVTVRHKNYVVTHPTNFIEQIYEGKLIHPEPWFKDDEFGITCSGEPYITFRVIRKNSIIKLSVNGNDALVDNNSNNTTTVLVQGSKGQTYNVRIVNGTAVSCTCKGFQFRQRCRHLKEAVDLINGSNVC